MFANPHPAARPCRSPGHRRRRTRRGLRRPRGAARPGRGSPARAWRRSATPPCSRSTPPPPRGQGPTDAGTGHDDRHGAGLGHRVQCGDKPVLAQGGRVDAAGEPDERVHRIVGRVLLLGEHRAGPVRRCVRQAFGQAQVHCEGDEVLLRPVVDVALEHRRRSSSWASTRRCRDACSSSTRAASSWARCSSSDLRTADRSASPACPARPAKSRSSTAVSGTPGCSCRTSTPSTFDACRTSRAPPRPALDPRILRLLETSPVTVVGPSAGQRAASTRRSSADDPDLGPGRARAVRQHLRHALRHVLHGVLPGDGAGEPAQHVEGVDARAVEELLDGGAEARLHPVEREHHDRGHDGERHARDASTEQPPAGDDHDGVDGEHERRRPPTNRQCPPVPPHVGGDRPEVMRQCAPISGGTGGGNPYPSGGAGTPMTVRTRRPAPPACAHPDGGGPEIARSAATPSDRSADRPQETPCPSPPSLPRRPQPRPPPSRPASPTAPATPRSRLSTTSASSFARRVHRDHGPVRVREVDAAPPARRPRPSHLGRGVPR